MPPAPSCTSSVATRSPPTCRNGARTKANRSPNTTASRATSALAAWAGLLTSCGEENLLKLEKDRYRGRDICVHEFAHNILGYGVSRDVRDKVREQYRRSLDHGLWVGSYAASNFDEFFAELTMWYFGTHGDLGMKGDKPANGRDGLKAYDPEAFALLDDFYSGRMEPAETSPASRRNEHQQIV